MNFTTVIFDMDGVLVDTERFYYQGRKDFFAEKGISTAHLSDNYFTGGRMIDMWPDILLDAYSEELAQKLQAEYLRATHPAPYGELLFPGVHELLDFLKSEKYQIGLASSSIQENIECCIRENHLETYFDAVLSGDDFVETKPNPEIYLTAMKVLSSKPTDTLIIEDSEKGILAGKATGATVWAIRDTFFGLNQSAADEIFDNLQRINEKLSAAAG